MNIAFLQLWLFQGFNYLSECRLIEGGSLAIAPCHVQSNWILLNAFKSISISGSFGFVVWIWSVPCACWGQNLSRQRGVRSLHAMSTDRLKWPQTILGREKAECRRRAVDSSASNTQCRLLRTYIDAESGERICIYKRHGTGLEELTLSMSAFLNCQTDFMCKRTAK